MVLRPRCDKSFQRVGEQDWVLDTRRGWKTCAPKLHRAQRTRDMAVVNRVIDGLHKCDLVVLRAVVAPDGYTVGRQPLAIAPQREDIHSAQVQRVSARAPENAYASGMQCRYRGRTTRPCVPAYTRAA